MPFLGQMKLAISLLLACATLVQVGSAMRLKDIASLEGRRDNQLVGYGLVIGLAGNGDSTQSVFTVQSVANMLERFGVTVAADDITSSNVAAVMVTADISAYIEGGSRIDVTVSAMGDADSIQGGILLQTPLMGADDEVYAVAQGPILLGGFSAGGADTALQRNHPTVGVIPGGAIVEQSINTQVVVDNALTFLLRNPDFASAVKVAERVNVFFPDSAEAFSPQGIRIRIPEDYSESPVTFIASVESIEVQPDITAKVVMNERTGTIVATSAVRLSEVAVSHGNITVSIARTPVISQPNALGGGESIADEAEQLNVAEDVSGLTLLSDSPTLQDLTRTLNTLGVGPRDMMVILQTINEAGALHAELVLK